MSHFGSSHTGDSLAFGSGLFLHYNAWQVLPGAMITSDDGERWEDARDYFFGGVVWWWRNRFWALESVEGHPPDDPDLWLIIGSRAVSSSDARTWETCSDFLPFDTAGGRPFATGAGRTLGLAFLPGGGGYALAVTEDGKEWLVLTNATDVKAPSSRCLAYGNGTYVWLAKPKEPESSQQVVFTSTNGMDWIPQATPTTNELLGIAYGNKTFVATGDNGTLLTSADGTNWTARPSGTAAKLSHAVFGGGRFVLTGEAVVRSAVQPQAVGEIRFMPRLCRRLSDGTMLLTVEGPYGQPVVVEGSGDLVNWEEIATDPCDRGEFEVYDEAAADLPQRFYRAHAAPPEPPPGPLEQWTLADTILEAGQTLDWKLAYGNGVFVAAGKKDDTKGSAWYSEDGLTWQPGDSAAAHEALAFGEGRFVSWASGMPMSSRDGQEWTKHESATPVPLKVGDLTFGRGRFLALGADPADAGYPRQFWFVSSGDGMVWQATQLPLETLSIEYDGGYVKSAVYAKGRAVFLEQYSVFSSADGENWTIGMWFEPDIWRPVSMETLLYGRGRFLANRDNDRVYVSEDGVTWSSVASRLPATWAYGNGAFLGASRSHFSDDPKMLYGSADGVTWTNLVELDTDDDLIDLMFAEGRFYGVNRKGEVWRSKVMPPHVSEPRVIPELTYRLPDGAMLVTVEAPYGHEVVVEASEDLVNWQEVGRDPCDRGEFEIYHETAGTGNQWFYRARQVAP